MEDFKSQLQTLMSDLSNQLINDAEGATKVIKIEVLNSAGTSKRTREPELTTARGKQVRRKPKEI